jgi:GWxTD domain-containing protein
MTLLHFIWEGAAIAFVLAFFLYVVRPASAQVRYFAACVDMLAMLAAFGVTLAHFWPAYFTMPPFTTALAWGTVTLVGAPGSAPALPADPFKWVTLTWTVGASLLFIRSVASWLSAQRLRRIGVCTAPAEWQKRLSELAEQVRVSRPIALLESALSEVPVVVGWLRPAILLPAGLLTGFPAEQIEFFLIHELAHIRRWDYLANLLQTVAENLLFYHPAVWWVSVSMRAERENCCDDVVASLGKGREFAEALISLEQRRGTLLEPALAATGGSLRSRVRRLLGQAESQRRIAAPALLIGILSVAIAIAFAAPQKRNPQPAQPASLPYSELPRLLAQAKQNPRPAPSTESATQEADPYRKWLDQEVVFIITKEEHSAFERLRTDEERKRFIEQFWLRRDPTPTTPENEYREEHYRRIAYANERFEEPQTPGWKTDRGSVYIKFGPPDELESLGATAAAPPKETWRYRFIQGIGADVMMEFVDASGTGEYRMTMDPNGPSKQANATPGQQGATGTILNVAARASGTVVAIHVTAGQAVTVGQLLVELDSDNPPYNRILSPVVGTVLGNFLQVGQRIRSGQPLFQIRPQIPPRQSREAPLSYFEAEGRSLQYQAGFEAAYTEYNSLADNALLDAERQFQGASKESPAGSPEARAALDRLRSVVAGARSDRLGSNSPPAPQAPWWAPDPQDAAAMVRAIEITAKILADGTAQDVTVTRSNDPGLNQSAIDAVQHWRFPILEGGRLIYTIRVQVDPSKLARR